MRTDGNNNSAFSGTHDLLSENTRLRTQRDRLVEAARYVVGSFDSYVRSGGRLASVFAEDVARLRDALAKSEEEAP